MKLNIEFNMWQPKLNLFWLVNEYRNNYHRRGKRTRSDNECFGGEVVCDSWGRVGNTAFWLCLRRTHDIS